jgi:hypothetical protein
VILGGGRTKPLAISRPGYDLKDGKWNHIAVSYSKENIITIVINGRLACQSEAVSSVQLCFGRRVGKGVFPFESMPFVGQVAEMRLWDTTLDPAYIKRGMLEASVRIIHHF